MREQIDDESLYEWWEFACQNQFEERADYRNGQLCALYSTAQGVKDVAPLDFMPWSRAAETEEEAYERRLQQAVNIMAVYSNQHNANIAARKAG